MNFSVSINSESGDKYFVYLAPLDADIAKELYIDRYNIEVYQIVIDRECGTNTADIHILNTISDFIARVFLSNKNLILYYYCDDVNQIPNSNHQIQPQEYRNRLFSAMINRYICNCNNSIVDTPITIIDAVGNAQYIHFISRSSYVTIVDNIVQYVIDNYSK